MHTFMYTSFQVFFVLRQDLLTTDYLGIPEANFEIFFLKLQKNTNVKLKFPEVSNISVTDIRTPSLLILLIENKWRYYRPHAYLC